MLLVGRSWEAKYRYGFNGYENLQEFGATNFAVDFGERIYDPRIGKFLSVDPLFLEYPWQGTFVFAHNNPISFIDYMGMGDPPSNQSDEIKSKSNGDNPKVIYSIDKIDSYSEIVGEALYDLELLSIELQIARAWYDAAYNLKEKWEGQNIIAWIVNPVAGILQYWQKEQSEADETFNKAEAKLEEAEASFNEALLRYNEAISGLTALLKAADGIDFGNGVVVHKNSNSATGDFALYEIEIDGVHYKFGVADAQNVLKTDVTVIDLNNNPKTIHKGTPIRIYIQHKAALKQYNSVNVQYEVHSNTTKAIIKSIEDTKIYDRLETYGYIGDGNTFHAKVKNVQRRGVFPKKLK